MSTLVLDFVQQLGRDLANREFDLPPFPDFAVRIQQCANSDEANFQKLGEIVAGEPSLAARVMRMSNSAIMRRTPIEITDINTAISRVGMSMVQNAAVSFAARESFKCPPGSPAAADLDRLRTHSVKVASISFVLARHTPYQGKPEEAMLAGLLHAVGKFYIYMRASQQPELFDEPEALRDLVAQWHTGVARAIVESWLFPESIARGVDEQELKERNRIEPADLSDVIYLSNILARAGTKAASALGDVDSLARLRINAEQLAQVLNESEEELQSMIDSLT
ncbi:MAG: HDOD domain-containing protein [Pseudomonadota bacterium]